MHAYRSYHGADAAKAIKFYYPHISLEEAENVATEMASVDWEKFGRDKTYQKARWLVQRFGQP
jgi:hypothetical protein